MSINVLIFTTRKPGTTLAEFKDYYENKHVPLGQRLLGSAFSHHTRHYIDHDNKASFIMGDSSGLPYDCVVTMRFRDQDHQNAALAKFSQPEVAAALAEDEAKFLDRDKTRAVSVGNVFESFALQ